jgi:hypothetical protein
VAKRSENTSAATAAALQQRVSEPQSSITHARQPVRYSVISCAMAPGRFPTFRDAVLFDQPDWVAYRTPLPAAAAAKGRASAERRMYQVVVGQGLRKVLGGRLKLVHVKGTVRPYMDGVLQGVRRILSNHYADGVEILHPICCGAGRAWHDEAAEFRFQTAVTLPVASGDAVELAANEAQEGGAAALSVKPAKGNMADCLATATINVQPPDNQRQETAPKMVPANITQAGARRGVEGGSIYAVRNKSSIHAVRNKTDHNFKASRRMEDRPATILDINASEQDEGSGAAATGRHNTCRASGAVPSLRRETGHSAGRQTARPNEDAPAALSDLGSGVPLLPCSRLAQRLRLPALSPALPPAAISPRPTNAVLSGLVPIRKRRLLQAVLGDDRPRFKVGSGLNLRNNACLPCHSRPYSCLRQRRCFSLAGHASRAGGEEDGATTVGLPEPEVGFAGALPHSKPRPGSFLFGCMCGQCCRDSM